MAETIREKNILFRAVFDDSGLVTGVKKATTATAQLDKEVEKVGKTSKKTSQETQTAFQKEAEAARKRNSLIKQELQDLKELRARRAQAYSVKEIREYNNRIKETETRIKTLRGSADATGGAFKQLGTVFTQVGLAFGAAFSVDKIIRFGAEAVQLANKAKNVRNAFNQLRDSTNILNELRAATSGTVDDLTLMRQAVRADNFKVPLEQLATFFKFASDRAAATGESVDYLVQSIVDGIGRKSTLVLDNLGISAAAIQEELKKTGDFGQAAANIIAQEMARANVNVDEGARATQRLDTAFLNLKLTIGERLAPTANTFLSNLTDGIKSATTLLSGASREVRLFGGSLSEAEASLIKNLRILEDIRSGRRPGKGEESLFGTQAALVEQNREYVRVLKLVEQANSAVGKSNEELGDAINVLNRELENNLKTYEIGDIQVDLLREALAKLTDEYNKQSTASLLTVKSTEEFKQTLSELQNALDLAIFEGNTEQINKLNRSIVALKNNYVSFTKDGLGAVKGNLFDINQQISELTQEQNAASTSVARVKDIEEELNKLYKERDLLLGRVNDQTNTYKKTIGDLADEIEAELRLTPLTSGFQQYYDDLDEAERITRQFNADLRKAIEEGNEQDEAIIRRELQEWEAKEKEKTDIAKREIEARELFQRTAVDGFIDIADALFRYQQELYNAELNNLQKQRDNKLITEQQFAAKIAAIQRKQAQADKASALFEIAINTAQAVSKVYAELGLAGNAVVGLIVAQGAIQAGIVAAQPIPQFAKGVIGLEGKGTETSDSNLAMLSKGESVMTAKETAKYRDVFEAIRNNEFEEFARERYIKPALLSQYNPSVSSTTYPEYNDYKLRKEVRENRNVGIKNADDIGRSVARHLNHNNWINRKFR